MSEKERNLTGEIQDQTLSSAERFFGDSIGFLKRRLESDRAQLQSLLENSSKPDEEAYSRLQKLVGSYEDIEYMLNRVIQKQEIQDLVEQPPARARQTGEETPQPTNDSLPPGSVLLSETKDERGRTVLRSLDESGTIIETALDELGKAESEDIVGVIADLTSKNGSG